MKEAFAQVSQQTEEQQKRCPQCGSEQVQVQGTKRRVLLTGLERVEVPLERLRCQECDQLFRPAEDCLAEVKGHNVTADLQELAALVGNSWPYATTAGTLARLGGVQLSDEQLRQLTNEERGKRAGQAATRVSSIDIARKREHVSDPCAAGTKRSRGESGPT